MKNFILFIALMAFVGFSAWGQSASTTPAWDAGTTPPTVNICVGGTLTVNITNPNTNIQHTLLIPGSPPSIVEQITSDGSGNNFSFTSLTFNTVETTTYTVSAADYSISQTFNVIVVADPLAPTLSKMPTNAAVCAGTDVKATSSAGSGGVSGCQDYYQYSTDGGSNWSSYSAGDNISTTDLTGTNIVQVKAWRTHPNGLGCMSGENLVSWTVNPQPVGPTLNQKTPDQGKVCEGTDVSATFTAGTGGVGCSDEFQYSYDGSTWYTYTEGTTVIGTNSQSGKTVTIQGRRSGCTTGAGCNGTAWTTLATWEVVTGVTADLSKTDASCDEHNGEISITNPSGGTGSYEYSINGGTNWQASATFSNLAPGNYDVRMHDTQTGCETTLNNTYAIVDLAAVALAAVNNASNAGQMQTALEDIDLCLDYTDYDNLVAGRKLAVGQDMLDNKPVGEYASIADVKVLFDELVSFRLAVQAATDAANDGSFTVAHLQGVNTAWATLIGKKINGDKTLQQDITDLQTFIDALDAMEDGRFAALVTDLAANGSYASFTQMYGMLDLLAQFRFVVADAVAAANDGSFEV
ncbi:MAG: hypothetical protein EOM83_11070, partial [Clostridia bacterium]|nr:hypothetical protein [Clostridia bacterium]